MFQSVAPRRIGLALVCAAILTLVSSAARAESQRHDGYYYPSPQTEERYAARVANAGKADRRTRIAFTTGLTAQMLAAPSPPRFAIFAKGNDAEKLIIVGLQDDAFNTLYRLRALLAMLTAYARSSPAFNSHPHPENLTFLDLIYLIGFEQVTVSDGREVSHRIYLDPPVQ
ncbi:molybdopterin-guanine dinucleotide biosynthesis protein A [Pacificispira sp.]|uniref:molybdopterin-guanine dinucleotide biosynthesis protein A n=1 Tax=Pacificispira sp. TaxID=2888761 RepID=UPI003BAC7786